MKSNSEFLSSHFPVLTNFGKLAEKYLYSDSNSCLIKLGLIEEAEKTAAAAPSVEKEARKKQSGRAASQRIKSEAETRYLIDEQLRQVGWEADTELLRYSKGTRPAKGRNIAITEWPTDSTVGDRGFVDYALFIDTHCRRRSTFCNAWSTS